ncbi:MAG: hypothetical protein NVSMB6_19050 [Burkholderiaceae bacterium]
MEPDNNPMQHPKEQAVGADGVPKFGRLLILLLVVVLLIGVLTFASEAYFS